MVNTEILDVREVMNGGIWTSNRELKARSCMLLLIIIDDWVLLWMVDISRFKTQTSFVKHDILKVAIGSIHTVHCIISILTYSTIHTMESFPRHTGLFT